MSSQHKNISVVGDDDQSIYKFRGAVIENILNFENQFERAKKIKLERNYRSVKNILEAANSLISKNEKRHDKKLWTSFDEGDLITYKTLYDEEDEASYICDTVEDLMNSGKSANDIAVFYRINAQSRPDYQPGRVFIFALSAYHSGRGMARPGDKASLFPSAAAVV